MSAPRQSSPLAADLAVPSEILQSLTSTSEITAPKPTLAKLSRMDSIPEESWEPEGDACQHCSEQPDSSVQGEQDVPSPAIAEYIAKMREGIRKQGQRLQQEEAEKVANTEGTPSTHENEKLEFHIKIVGRERPGPLLLDAKVHGKDLFAGLKSKARQVTFALTEKSASKGTRPELHSPLSKRFSLSALAKKGKKRISSVKSRWRRTSVLFPLTWSKQSKESEARPKIKGNNSATPTPPMAKGTDDAPYSPDSSSTLAQEDGEYGEEVPLLWIKSPASYSVQSFDASHFYTPMVPSRTRHEYERHNIQRRILTSLKSIFDSRPEHSAI